MNDRVLRGERPAFPNIKIGISGDLNISVPLGDFRYSVVKDWQAKRFAVGIYKVPKYHM